MKIIKSILRKNYYRKAPFLIFTLILFTGIQANMDKIALIPFTANAEEDLSISIDGVLNILSSRLLIEGKTLIIDSQEVKKAVEEFKNYFGENLALMVGAKLQANYVIYGSITVSGENISIFSKFIDVSGKKTPITFSQHVQNLNAIIPKINLFATEINEKGFVAQSNTIIDSDSIPEKTEQSPLGAKDTIDTLAIIEESSQVDKIVKIPVKEQPKEVSPSTDTSYFSKTFWKSRNYNILINGIAVGDVNNDNKVETIVLTDEFVQLYRCKGKNIIKVLDIKKVRNRYPIGIDIADINKNGFKEIIVTCLDMYQNRVNSLVLEYDGEQYNTIVKNYPWYLRVVNVNDSTPLLLGQRHGKNAPFKGKIFEMKWEKSQYKPGKQLLPSRGINVIGVAYGDLMNNGKNVVAGYTKLDNIRILNTTTGKKIWDSRERFGGTTLFYKLDGSSSIDREYLAMRLLVKDVNANGKKELIAVKNHEVARNILAKFKYYNKSHIEILTWDGLGLTSIEKTNSISGNIRDFTIGDFNNDGKDEFVAALVQKEGRSLFNKPQSCIISYQMR